MRVYGARARAIIPASIFPGKTGEKSCILGVLFLSGCILSLSRPRRCLARAGYLAEPRGPPAAWRRAPRRRPPRFLKCGVRAFCVCVCVCPRPESEEDALRGVIFVYLSFFFPPRGPMMFLEGIYVY